MRAERMTDSANQDPEMPWDRPLARIAELEQGAIHELSEAGSTDGVEKIRAFERQWSHTQLAQLVQSWSKMDLTRKRMLIDALSDMKRSFDAAELGAQGATAAKRTSDLMDVLSDMTPSMRSYIAEQRSERGK